MIARGASLRAVASAAVAAAAVGCTAGGADADLRPPPGFQPPPIRALHNVAVDGRLGFGRGFWPMEVGSDGKTWRWMSDRGEVRLLAQHRPRRLRIVGWLPLEFLAAPPTLHVRLGDRVLDSFVASERGLDRAYLVTPDLFGGAASALLVIETSATAHVPGEPRDLGVSIESVRWD